MTSTEINTIAAAEQDYRNGMRIDHNPNPIGTAEYRIWQLEFERLLGDELHDELRVLR